MLIVRPPDEQLGRLFGVDVPPETGCVYHLLCRPDDADRMRLLLADQGWPDQWIRVIESQVVPEGRMYVVNNVELYRRSRARILLWDGVSFGGEPAGEPFGVAGGEDDLLQEGAGRGEAAHAVDGAAPRGPGGGVEADPAGAATAASDGAEADAVDLGPGFDAGAELA